VSNNDYNDDDDDDDDFSFKHNKQNCKTVDNRSRRFSSFFIDK